MPSTLGPSIGAQRALLVQLSTPKVEYGVKGMKWGKKKQKDSSGTSSGGGMSKTFVTPEDIVALGGYRNLKRQRAQRAKRFRVRTGKSTRVGVQNVRHL